MKFIKAFSSALLGLLLLVFVVWFVVVSWNTSHEFWDTGLVILELELMVVLGIATIKHGYKIGNSKGE